MALDLKGLTQDDAFAKAASYSGVPESVLRGQWKVESSEGKNMLSPAGAKGHFGLMDSTRHTWEERNGKTYNPNDFNDSLEVAADTMKENLAATGNVPDALRMYNAGTDRSHWGNPETTAYVPKVLGGEAHEDISGYEVHGAQPLTPEQAWTTSAFDLRAKAKTETDGAIRNPELAGLMKGAVDKDGMDAAVLAATGGGDPVQASFDALQQGREHPLEVMTRQAKTDADAPFQPGNFGPGADDWQDTLAREQIMEKHQAEIDSHGNLERIGANFSENTTLGALWHLSDSLSDPRFGKVDPHFNVLDPKVQKDIYAYANDEDEIDQQLGARSQASLENIRETIQRKRANAVLMSDGVGTGTQVFNSLLAGVLDPPSWFVGAGVGKTFKLAGIGSRAAFAAGKRGTGIALSAAEGAVGNLAITKLMDTMGQYQSTRDYGMSAGMGMFFGGLGGVHAAFGAQGKLDAEAIAAHGNTVAQEAAEAQHKTYTEAVAEAGPNATSEEIQAVVRKKEFESMRRQQEAILGDADAADMILPRIDAEGYKAIGDALAHEFTPDADLGTKRLYTGGEAHEDGSSTWYHQDYKTAQEFATKFGDGTVRYLDLPEHDPLFKQANKDYAFPDTFNKLSKSYAAPVDLSAVFSQYAPNAILKTRAQLDAAIVKHGLDKSTSSGIERAMFAEIAEKAERWVAANPQNLDRVSKVLEAAGWESTGQALATDKTALAKMLAGTLLESSSGVTGVRRETAAITANMMYNRFVGTTLREEERVYNVWRDKNGGSSFKDLVFGDRQRREFNKRVYSELDRRWNESPLKIESDQHVLAAADLWDKGYAPMAHAQAHARTPGSLNINLGKLSGYVHRTWDSRAVRAMAQKSKKYANFVDTLGDEFHTYTGYDKEFADKFAVEYAETIRREAALGVDTPATMIENLDGVEKAIRKVTGDEGVVAAVMAKMNRGAAGHTKTRTDLRLSRTFKDDDGSVYSLLDFVNTDMHSLFRNYARRTAGEVAAAKFGVMGSSGFEVQRRALEALGASEKAIKAFDQVSAEFLGRPPKRATQLGTAMTNLRHMAQVLRMGGAGFQQGVESANVASALGVDAAVKSVALMPKFIQRARRLAEGKEAFDPVLTPLAKYTDEIGMEGYLNHNRYDNGDVGESFGKEKLGVVTRAVRSGSHLGRVMSGHRAILAAQQMGVSKLIVQKAMRYIKEGGDDVALRDMGITDELAASIKEDIGKVATFDKDGDAIGIDLDHMKTGDVNAFVTAVKRGAGQLIQEAYIGETGKWAHDDFLKLLTQFRTFSIISIEKQWNRQVGVNGLGKTIGYTLGAMSIAVPVYLARTALKGSMISDETKRKEYMDGALGVLPMGRALMNYSSAMGGLPDMLDATMGILGKGDYAQAGRGSNRGGSFVGGQIAPAIGVANDIAGALTQHDLHSAMRVMPYSSNPMFHAAVGLIREASDDNQ